MLVSPMWRETMLSVRGIYENGKVMLIEPILSKRRTEVIVTLLDEPAETENQKVNINLFDDLVGIVASCEDGSIKHDQYINAPAGR